MPHRSSVSRISGEGERTLSGKSRRRAASVPRLMTAMPANPRAAQIAASAYSTATATFGVESVQRAPRRQSFRRFPDTDPNSRSNPSTSKTTVPRRRVFHARRERARALAAVPRPFQRMHSECRCTRTWDFKGRGLRERTTSIFKFKPFKSSDHSAPAHLHLQHQCCGRFDDALRTHDEKDGWSFFDRALEAEPRCQ